MLGEDLVAVATQKDRVTTEGRGGGGGGVVRPSVRPAAVVRGIIVTKKVARPSPVVQRLSAQLIV